MNAKKHIRIILECEVWEAMEMMSALDAQRSHPDTTHRLKDILAPLIEELREAIYVQKAE